MYDGDKSGDWLWEKKERKKKKTGQNQDVLCVPCVSAGEREREEGRGGERFKDTEDEMWDMR